MKQKPMLKIKTVKKRSIIGTGIWAVLAKL